MTHRTEEVMEVEDQFFRTFSYFTAEEMRCKCGQCALPIADPEFRDFMFKLQHLRSVCDFPFRINSGYRCPEYNAQVSSTGQDGPHTKGAADIGASFERAYKLVNEASSREMGVGIQQKGDVAGRFIHVDNLGPRIWTY